MKVFKLHYKNPPKNFLKYLHRKIEPHIFTLYDLKYHPNETDITIAENGNRIYGYMLKFNLNIHLRGYKWAVEKLLQTLELREAIFSIMPNHLKIIQKHYEILGPVTSCKANVTEFIVMKVSKNNFKPIVKHRVERLSTEDLNKLKEIPDERQINTMLEALKYGEAYIIRDNKRIVAMGTAFPLTPKNWLIRGIYTIKPYRGLGLGTSITSAITKRIVEENSAALLLVDKENEPAIKIYKKLGFKDSGIRHLAFHAKNIKTVNSSLNLKHTTDYGIISTAPSGQKFTQSPHP